VLWTEDYKVDDSFVLAHLMPRGFLLEVCDRSGRAILTTTSYRTLFDKGLKESTVHKMFDRIPVHSRVKPFCLHDVSSPSTRRNHD
jgi:hypothetical protein